MKCKQIEQLLSYYLDNMLDAQQKLSVEDHLKTCSDCKRLIEDCKTNLLLLKELRKESNG